MFKRFKTLCTKKMGSHLWTSRLRTRHVRATLVRTGQWEPLSRQKRTHGQRPVKSSAWRDFLRDMLLFHGQKRGTERPFFRSVAHLGMCKWELFFFFLKNRGGLYRTRGLSATRFQSSNRNGACRYWSEVPHGFEDIDQSYHAIHLFPLFFTFCRTLFPKKPPRVTVLLVY